MGWDCGSDTPWRQWRCGRRRALGLTGGWGYSGKDTSRTYLGICGGRLQMTVKYLFSPVTLKDSVARSQLPIQREGHQHAGVWTVKCNRGGPRSEEREDVQAPFFVWLVTSSGLVGYHSQSGRWKGIVGILLGQAEALEKRRYGIFGTWTGWDESCRVGTIGPRGSSLRGDTLKVSRGLLQKNPGQAFSPFWGWSPLDWIHLGKWSFLLLLSWFLFCRFDFEDFWGV